MKNKKLIKPTLLDYAILGLIQEQPLSGYAIRKLFEEVVRLGGTISGEHGIGLVQKGYMDIVFSDRQLSLMRSIKRAFDPKGIMNPGKVL